jgi:hypothetical protein
VFATGDKLEYIPTKARIFLFHTGTYPDSCPVGVGTLLPGFKQQEYEANHSPPTNADVKNSLLPL